MNCSWLALFVSCGLVLPCFGQEQKEPFTPSQVAKHLYKRHQYLERLKAHPTAENDLLKIRDQLSKCWNSPPTKENIRIDILIKLDPKGMLNGAPQVQTEAKDDESKAIIAAATKAVIACQPFKAPKSSYEFWRELSLTFDTKDEGPPIRRKAR